MRIAFSSLCQTVAAARKVLVVDLGFVGDTVHLVPALWELKRNSPCGSLQVLTSTVGAEVLRLVPCVDRAWAIEMNPNKRSLLQQLRVMRAIRRERFDVALNFSGADRGVFLTGFSGARIRAGHQAGRKHFWTRWFVPVRIPYQNPQLPVYEQRRQVLRVCGWDLEPPAWRLRLPEAALRKAEALTQGTCIHFSINASIPLKEWPLPHWIELADRLASADSGVQIICSGGPGEREQARLRTFAASTSCTRALTLPADTTIVELAAVLQRCQAHVGADSGVLHLAVALGVRTVSLFRQYHDASAWFPVGPEHRVFQVPCSCVNQYGGPCNPAGPAECLVRIGPAEVASAVLDQLRNSRSIAQDRA